MRNKAIKILATVTVAGSVSACASSGTSGADGCSSELRASSRSLAEVLDSTTAQDGLSLIWPEGAGLAVARIGGSADTPIIIWSESLSDAQADEVRDLLAATATVPLDNPDRVYLFLGDERGPAPRRVDRLAQCPPRIFNRTGLANRIAAEASGLGLEQRVVVYLLVYVEASGVAGEVRIDETSGDFRVDRAAARVFDGVNFIPARVEGMPVAVWARFPVTFTPR